MKHKLAGQPGRGQPAHDSAAVQLVLSLFKLADHPGDLRGPVPRGQFAVGRSVSDLHDHAD